MQWFIGNENVSSLCVFPQKVKMLPCNAALSQPRVPYGLARSLQLATRTRTGCVVARHGRAASCNSKKSHHGRVGAVKGRMPRRSIRVSADSAGAEAEAEAEPTPTAEPTAETLEQPNSVREFKDIGMDDVAEVGGKNASLGEMFAKLTGQVRVPTPYTELNPQASPWSSAPYAVALSSWVCSDLTFFNPRGILSLEKTHTAGSACARWLRHHGECVPRVSHLQQPDGENHRGTGRVGREGHGGAEQHGRLHPSMDRARSVAAGAGHSDLRRVPQAGA